VQRSGRASSTPGATSFGSRRPIDVIKAKPSHHHLDEPQEDGGAATQNALKKNFNPLFSLNYSGHAQNLPQYLLRS
jgi:hypothetical protein